MGGGALLTSCVPRRLVVLFVMYFLFFCTHLSSSFPARTGALKERSAQAESLEDQCSVQESLLQKKEESLEEVCAEAERLRRELDAESQRLANAKETFEADVATATASAEAQAAARALELAESSARLGNASEEIETLKVRRWNDVLDVCVQSLHCRHEMRSEVNKMIVRGATRVVCQLAVLLRERVVVTMVTSGMNSQAVISVLYVGFALVFAKC